MSILLLANKSGIKKIFHKYECINEDEFVAFLS